MTQKIQTAYETLKQSVKANTMRPLAARRAQLKNLRVAIKQNEQKIIDAAKSDLGRPPFETFALELAMIKEELNLALAKLDEWSCRRVVKTPLIMQPGSSYIEPVPKGLVLIMAPWNYPMQLSLVPLISAIAAGNCVILKPSEVAESCARLLRDMLDISLDENCVRVITGDVDTAKTLLDLSFDHIFYTGNTAVGREVMTKAAKHLTPVTLELGGKSPCIIDAEADLDVAIKRILWGKFVNAGQTCIAPDYVLISEDKVDSFIKIAKIQLVKMYGENPQTSPSYGRIINQHHMQRLAQYLKCGSIAHGGTYDMAERFFAPTLLTNIHEGSGVLNEEIFGPILPIIGVKNTAGAIKFVNQHPNPLSLYIFSNNNRTIDNIGEQTNPGGICINDCLSHAGVIGLPFGGVRTSGMGSYHGHFGFETFSHLRAVHRKATVFDNPVKYAPYSKNKLNLVKLVM